MIINKSSVQKVLSILLVIIGVAFLFKNIKPSQEKNKPNQPDESISQPKTKARFIELEDDRNDEIDLETGYKKFSSKRFYISFLYPSFLYRLNDSHWLSIPPEEIAHPTAGEIMNLYYFYDITDEEYERIKLLDIGQSIVIDKGTEEQETLKKIHTKSSNNLQGFIVENVLEKTTYWQPLYQMTFVTDKILPRNNRIVLTFSTNSSSSREEYRDDFISTIDSIKYTDLDKEFIQSLNLKNLGYFELTKSGNSGIIIYLHITPKEISDYGRELFLITNRENGSQPIGYIVSRTINLEKHVGKRMIINIRNIDGYSINNLPVFIVDDINII